MASLIGGVVVGAAVFILWYLILRDIGRDGPTALLLGLAVAGGIAAWIRIADL